MTIDQNQHQVLAKIRTLLEQESDDVAIMSIVGSLLYAELHLVWVGFYRRRGDELVLGPFQGPPVCTRIDVGQGVCGTCAKNKVTLNVPDVTKFPGYIEGNATAKSELTVPIIIMGEVAMILDADATELAYFSDERIQLFETIAKLLEKRMCHA